MGKISISCRGYIRYLPFANRSLAAIPTETAFAMTALVVIFTTALVTLVTLLTLLKGSPEGDFTTRITRSGQ